jgi:putative transposase
MSRTRYHFIEGDKTPYFITSTTVNWLPLFSNPEIAQIILETLRYLIDHKRINLYAYVILENHLHLIADADDLSKEIANFKSYTARNCIDRYKSLNNQFILDQLILHKLPFRHDQDFQVWQEGSHPERILDEAMFQQKVDYIHNNPVKRGYVDVPEHWRYSSSRNYSGLPGLLPIAGIEYDV